MDSKTRAYRVFLLLQGGLSFFLALVFTSALIYRIDTIHLDPFQLVIVGTVLEATAFLFEVPTGVVADTFSRRLSIILGVVFLGAGVGLEGFIPLFAAVLVGQVISGIGYTFLSGATEAWIADELGTEQLKNVFNRSSQVQQICGIAGAVVSMGLGSVNLAWPIALGGTLTVVLAGVLALLMPETGFKPAPREERTSWRAMGNTFTTGAGIVRRQPRLLTFLLIEAFFGLASEGWDRLLTAHFLMNFEFPQLWGLKPVVWLGTLGILGGLLNIPALEFVRRRMSTASREIEVRALSVFTALRVLSVLVFSFAPTFAVAVGGWWGKGIFESVQGPIYRAWLNQSIDSRVRATVLSISSQMNAVGQIAGGPGIGLVGNTSVRWALALSGLLVLPVIPLFGRAHRQGGDEAADAAKAAPAADLAAAAEPAAALDA